MPDVHEFAARRTARRLVTALLAVGVLVTAYLASLAYDRPSQSSIALAALAAFVTAIVWAVRASTVVTTLIVRDGTLEVTRAGATDTFDLTSAQTPVELVGVPGERGWKALFVRQGKPPYELTASDVDPAELTRVVRYHRPGEPTSST